MIKDVVIRICRRAAIESYGQSGSGELIAAARAGFRANRTRPNCGRVSDYPADNGEAPGRGAVSMRRSRKPEGQSSTPTAWQRPVHGGGAPSGVGLSGRNSARGRRGYRQS